MWFKWVLVVDFALSIVVSACDDDQDVSNRILGVVISLLLLLGVLVYWP